MKIDSSQSGFVEVEGRGLTQKEIEVGTFNKLKMSFCVQNQHAFGYKESIIPKNLIYVQIIKSEVGSFNT